MRNLMIILLFYSISAASAENATVSSGERFQRVLSKLKKGLKSANSKKIKQERFSDLSPLQQATALSAAGVRVAAFELQGLGRIYSDYSKGSVAKLAEEIAEEAELLEDGLGEVDLNKNSLHEESKAEASAQELMNHIRKQQWLTEDGKTPYLDNLVKKVKKINWGSAEEDRLFVLENLKDQVKTVDQTDYDVRYLEAGVHHLRRQLRWFTLKAIALGGLIQKSDKGEFNCRQKQIYFREFVDPKYANLPPANEGEKVCYLSSCLYDELVGAVGAFGKVKDKAEPLVKKDKKTEEKDLTPDSLVGEAQLYYQQLIDSQILGRLKDEIKACR